MEIIAPAVFLIFAFLFLFSIFRHADATGRAEARLDALLRDRDEEKVDGYKEMLDLKKDWRYVLYALSAVFVLIFIGSIW